MDNMDNLQNNNNLNSEPTKKIAESSAPNPTPISTQNSTSTPVAAPISNLNVGNLNDKNLDKVKAVPKKKKKSKIVFFVEIFLMLVVIVLILIFLNGNGIISLKFLNQSKTVAPTNELVNINNTETNVQEFPSRPDNTDVPVTEVINNNNSNSRPAVVTDEDLRLSLPVPKQSVVSTEDEVPAGAIKIYGNENGFEPNEFKAGPNQEITLALISKIELPMILTFYEPNMPAVSIGCGPNETRWITFTTPNQLGEYVFRNDAIGRSSQAGKMIVE